MALAKGARAEYRINATSRFGFIAKTGAKVTMILDDGVHQVTGATTLFSPSHAPLPAGSPFEREFSVRDRVEFDVSGKTEYGTIRKRKGVYYEVRGDDGIPFEIISLNLRPTTTPAPVSAPSVMDRWRLKSYQRHKSMSQETTAFNATVLLDGKPAFFAENSGRGGCNLYRPIAPDSHAKIDAFTADAKTWAKENGDDNPFEPDGLWIEWAGQHAKTGLTAKAFYKIALSS
jgi:hypothetical protein